jgi:hypothetical protein
LRPSERIFYVDFNGNCAWNEATGDKSWGPLGILNSMPVAGNWDGNGKSEVGTFQPISEHLLLGHQRPLVK